MPGFAELAARSHYSFLEGAASPRIMVETAARLGLSALGLCDPHGLDGAVELIQAAKVHGIHPIIGTELELAGGSRLRLLARSRTGYRQLCRAVSAAQLAGVKGQPRLVIDGLESGATVSGQGAFQETRRQDPSGSDSRGASRAHKRPTLPPPERPASLRPTAGPFPAGWPGLPSTTLLVESEPARGDPPGLPGWCGSVSGADAWRCWGAIAGVRRIDG